MDALLTQRTLAAQTLAQGDRSLMVVKDNQPAVLDAIMTLFATPPVPAGTDLPDPATTGEKGHGRRELRTLERSAALNDDLSWPGSGQVLRRTCQRVILDTRVITVAVAVDGNNRDYVTDSTDSRVQQLDRNGTFLSCVGGGHVGDRGAFDQPFDITFVNTGKGDEVDSDRPRIQKFAPARSRRR